MGQPWPYKGRDDWVAHLGSRARHVYVGRSRSATAVETLTISKEDWCMGCRMCQSDCFTFLWGQQPADPVFQWSCGGDLLEYRCFLGSFV